MTVTDKNQTIILEDKKRLTIDSVINVESFNDDYLEVSTKLGDICVEGNNLKIEELRQDNGKVLITGEISGVFYREQRPSKKLFSGIFK